MSSVYKIEPKYYRNSKGKGDLISVFSNGPLMTHDEAVGFLKGNIFKYVTRYKDKNGEEDLLKANEYLERLMAVEYLGQKKKKKKNKKNNKKNKRRFNNEA